MMHEQLQVRRRLRSTLKERGMDPRLWRQALKLYRTFELAPKSLTKEQRSLALCVAEELQAGSTYLGMGLFLGSQVAMGGGWAPNTETDLTFWTSSTGDAGLVQLETGTETDLKRIQEQPVQGSIGGVMQQTGSSSARPLGTRFAAGLAAYFAEGRRLVSNRPPASFAFLHDGTSNYDIWIPMRVEAGDAYFVFNTFNEGSSNVGVSFATTSDGRVRYRVGNGSAVSTAQSSAGVLNGSAAAVRIKKRGTAISIEVEGAEVADGTIASPSASDPQHTLTIGASNTGSVPTTGWIPELFIFSGDEERPQALPYIQRHTLELDHPSTLGGLVARFPPDTHVVADGDLVEWVNELNAAEHTADAPSEAERPPVLTVQVEFGGVDCVGIGLTSALGINLDKGLRANSLAPIANGTGPFTVYTYGRASELVGGVRTLVGWGDDGTTNRMRLSPIATDNYASNRNNGTTNNTPITAVPMSTDPDLLTWGYRSDGTAFVQRGEERQSETHSVGSIAVTTFGFGRVFLNNAYAAAPPWITPEWGVFDRILNVGEIAALEDFAQRKYAPWTPEALDADLAFWTTSTGDAGLVQLESGTEDDLKRIQSQPVKGTIGGVMAEGSTARRPLGTKFAAGLAGFFADSGMRLQSDRAASAFTRWHDDREFAIAGVIRPESTSTQFIIRTTTGVVSTHRGFLALLSSSGFGIRVGNGSSFIVNTNVAIDVRKTYRWLFRKQPTSGGNFSWQLWLAANGASLTVVASGTTASPASSDAPNRAADIGDATVGMQGCWFPEVFVLDSYDVPIEQIDAYLQQHTLELPAADPEHVLLSGETFATYDAENGVADMRGNFGALAGSSQPDVDPDWNGLDAWHFEAGKFLDLPADVVALFSGTDKSGSILLLGEPNVTSATQGLLVLRDSVGDAWQDLLTLNAGGRWFFRRRNDATSNANTSIDPATAETPVSLVASLRSDVMRLHTHDTTSGHQSSSATPPSGAVTLDSGRIAQTVVGGSQFLGRIARVTFSPRAVNQGEIAAIIDAYRRRLAGEP